jgi:DivIVA domain-containing protein
VVGSPSTDPGVDAAQNSAVVSDTLSPDDIEKTTFHSTPDGYDKVEVEVFLHAVASDMHALKRELESARLSAHRPLEALGREMGALMQHAHDTAERVRKSAETEAATTLQRAHRDATKLRQDAEQLKKRYETETLVARDEAMATVDRLREQAEQQRRLAKAESSIMQQEAWRSAKRIQDEAKRKAQEILVKADSEARARTAESERRLRKLQEVETKLRRRIESLSTKLQTMIEQVKRPMTEERNEGTEERRDEPSGRPSRSASIRITDNGTVSLDPSEQGSPSQIAPNRS